MGGLSAVQSDDRKEFTEDEALALSKRWLSVFGKDRQGVNTNAFMWHVLSSGRYPGVAREAALEAYAAQAGVEFVVLCNDRKRAVLVGRRPEAGLWSDCYVFPPNFAWTMAFTHEDGWIGPLFARHPDYEALDAENQATLRKAQEKDAARQKGWY